MGRGDGVIRGKDPNRYRQDPYDNEMFKASYGLDSEKGWVIDHIVPVSHGGSDELSNLQAMNTAKNRELGDSMDKKTRYSQEDQGLGTLIGLGLIAAAVWLFSGR